MAKKRYFYARRIEEGKNHILKSLTAPRAICGKSVMKAKVLSDRIKPFPKEEVCPKCWKLQ